MTEQDKYPCEHIKQDYLMSDCPSCIATNLEMVVFVKDKEITELKQAKNKEIERLKEELSEGKKCWALKSKSLHETINELRSALKINSDMLKVSVSAISPTVDLEAQLSASRERGKDLFGALEALRAYPVSKQALNYADDVLERNKELSNDQ